MKTNFYKLSLLLTVFLLSTAATFSQVKLLYVDADEANPACVLIEGYLNLDYDITFVTSADFKVTDGDYSQAATYADYDAILIGEALGSGDVWNFHVAGYPIPCVTTEGWAYKTAGTKWCWLSD